MITDNLKLIVRKHVATNRIVKETNFFIYFLEKISFRYTNHYGSFS